MEVTLWRSSLQLSSVNESNWPWKPTSKTRSRARSVKPELQASHISDVGSILLGVVTVAAQHAPCKKVQNFYWIKKILVPKSKHLIGIYIFQLAKQSRNSIHVEENKLHFNSNNISDPDKISILDGLQTYLINWNRISQMQELRRRCDWDDLTRWRSLARSVRPTDDHQVEDVSRVWKLAIRQRGSPTFQDQLLDSLVPNKRLMQRDLWRSKIIFMNTFELERIIQYYKNVESKCWIKMLNTPRQSLSQP